MLTTLVQASVICNPFICTHIHLLVQVDYIVRIVRTSN